MSSMSNGDVETKPQRRWFENPWMMAAVSLVACVLASTAEQLCRFTLEPLKIVHVEMALFFSGAIIGGLLFFLIIGPCQFLIVSIGHWRRLKARTTSLLMLIPTVYMICSMSAAAISWRHPTPASELKRFEAITGVPWPTDAKLLLAEHGWGMQDKRHLWLFEGTPEQFDKLVRDRGWVLEDTPMSGDILKWMPVEKAIQRFSKDSAWSVHEVYFWMADKDAEKGPFGPGNLITDKKHRRWCVWWDAI
jgi:hypothetical protein